MREQGTYTDGTAPATATSDDVSESKREQERQELTPDVMRYPGGHGQGRLDTFLNSTPLAGNDEQYAAALALIGNRLGIPTRVVVGATATEDGKIRGRDIHAWVEVQQGDGGWFQVLPATFLPDEKTRKAPATTPTPWEPTERTAIPEPPAPPPVRTGPAVDWSSPSTWPLWAQLLGAFGGGPFLLLLVTPGIIATRRSIRQRRGRPDQRIGRAWNDLIEEARTLGRDVPEGGTRVEQAVAMGRAVDALPVALRADTLVFAEAPPGAGAVATWQRELRTVRRRLRRESPFVARLLTTFDPRPLFSRQVDVGLHDTITAPSRKALR